VPLTVKHNKVSAILDDPAAVAAGEVVPSDWNADHPVTGTLDIANGGTGQTTRQAALNGLAGATTSGQFLRGNGTNVAMSTIQAADVPTLNQNTTGTASNVTGTVAIANGGTGQTTANAAVNALLPSQSGNSGKFLTTNGTDASWATAGGGGSATLSIQNKTSAYTVVAGDLGTIINCTSGTFTVALTAAATLGSGFNCWIWNTSTTTADVITIDPNASETIDGAGTLPLRRGEGCQIICDGANWQTGDKKAMRGYAENLSATTNRPVAVGNGAIALGTAYASGTDSFAAAITNNSSSFGAKGASSLALGRFANATATGATAIGDSCSATATNATTLGYSSSATAINSSAFGAFALAAINGKHAFSSEAFAAVGDSQTGVLVLRVATANATSAVLTSDPNAASAANQVILPNNSAFAFTGTLIARQKASGGSNYAAWEVKGAIIRGANAASTSLGSYNINVLSKTAGAASWAVALSADTTNGGLAITVTGAAATDIRWVATVQTSEVTYA
jgi:hypothetical protein